MSNLESEYPTHGTLRPIVVPIFEAKFTHRGHKFANFNHRFTTWSVMHIKLLVFVCSTVKEVSLQDLRIDRFRFGISLGKLTGRRRQCDIARRPIASTSAWMGSLPPRHIWMVAYDFGMYAPVNEQQKSQVSDQCFVRPSCE